MSHVAIVGGGIAGLATAYYTRKYAVEAGLDARFTLIEREPALGGKIATVQRDGFIIEGGPDSFLTQKPWALQLARELGLSDQLLGTNDERRTVYVLLDDKLVELPDGVMLVVPTKIWPFVSSPLISWPGKLRMGLDLVVPPRRDASDESLAAFIRRRLGQEALDKIAEPLMAGIHVADPERLSLQATFPRFIAMEQEHGSLIRGMLASRRRRSRQARPASNGRQPTTAFMSLHAGLTDLVAALADNLQQHGSLRVGELATAIDYAPHKRTPYTVVTASGPSLAADAVVLATPAFVSANLVDSYNPALAAGLRRIRYVSTATVSLAFRAAGFDHPLDGFGFVIPEAEGRRIAACTWTSTKFDHRTPDGYVLVRAFVGGPGAEQLVELNDTAMVEMVLAELADIMGVRAAPVLAEIFRWPKGNPQYDVGHLDRVDELERACQPGLFLTGSAYRGVGIPDCTRSGKRTAEAVVAYLAAGATRRQRESEVGIKE
jgi:oxygen-dependent protoporphyrinogen oxidase